MIGLCYHHHWPDRCGRRAVYPVYVGEERTTFPNARRGRHNIDPDFESTVVIHTADRTIRGETRFGAVDAGFVGTRRMVAKLLCRR
jgi:hypothetical protein